MEFTKDLIGEKIFAVGTGNNARYKKGEFENFVVVDIKTKYVHLRGCRADGSLGDVDSYCKETGATQTEINRGYGLMQDISFIKICRK